MVYIREFEKSNWRQKKSEDTLAFLKKKYPEKKIIIVTEEMIGKDRVNKCRSHRYSRVKI